MPQYRIEIGFRVDSDREALDVRGFMEKMLCDFLKDRPAVCVRVGVSEVDSEGNIVRVVEPVRQVL
jgi:hypothetical protein